MSEENIYELPSEAKEMATMYFNNAESMADSMFDDAKGVAKEAFSNL